MTGAADRRAGASWAPHTWRAFPAHQMPQYPDPERLRDVESQLATHPPLVFAGEVRELRAALAESVVAGDHERTPQPPPAASSRNRSIRAVTAAGCSACSQWPAPAMVTMDAAGKRARMRGVWCAAR